MLLILVSFFVLTSSLLEGSQFYLEVSNEDMGFLGEIPRGLRGSAGKGDGNYTQGLYFSYSFKPKESYALSFFFQQDLFTPSYGVKEEPFAQKGSRAFASYSGFGGALKIQKSYFLQQLTVYGGGLGPSSLGAQMQNFFHKTFRGKEGYEGWDDQIEGGAIGLLQYSLSLRKTFFCDFLCLELSPSSSFTFGNLASSFSVGGSFRIGTNLEKDHGPRVYSFLSEGALVSRAKSFSWNFFVSFFKVNVFHNALLHGKTLKTQIQTVEPFSELEEVYLGSDIMFKKWLFSLLFVLRSKEYKEQKPYEFIRFGVGYRL